MRTLMLSLVLAGVAAAQTPTVEQRLAALEERVGKVEKNSEKILAILNDLDGRLNAIMARKDFPAAPAAVTAGTAVVKAPAQSFTQGPCVNGNCGIPATTAPRAAVASTPYPASFQTGAIYMYAQPAAQAGGTRWYPGKMLKGMFDGGGCRAGGCGG